MATDQVSHLLSVSQGWFGNDTMIGGFVVGFTLAFILGLKKE
ncbi:MAG TPA: hypothetical protein VIX38_04915 [Nitrososphaeraceae archaeon]